MKGPVTLLREAFTHAMKKSSLVFGAIYFAIAIVVAMGIAAIAVVASIIGIGALVAVNSVYVTLAAIIVLGFLALVVLLVIQAAINILSMSGFSQTMDRDNFNFDQISESVKHRVFPAVVTTAVVTLAYALALGILVSVFYLALQEIGLILALVLYIAFVVFTAPLFILATPTVVFENVGGFEAVARAMSVGARNYLLNLASILLMAAFSFVLMVLSIIPLLNIIISYFFTILFTIFVISLYRENRARTQGI